MIDPNNVNLAFLILDLVDNSVRASASRPETLELAPQFVPYLAGRIEQGSEYEFDDRRCNLLGKPSQRPFSRGSHNQLPAGRAQRFRYRALSSSARIPLPRAISLRAR